jgi:hypothetical protein
VCGGWGSANLIENGQTPNGTPLFFDADEEKICHISPNCQGEYIEVIRTKTKEFPNEAKPRNDGLVVEAGRGRFLRGAKEGQENNDITLSEQGSSRHHSDDDGGNLDVMVVWTKKEECLKSEYTATCSVDITTETNMIGLVKLAVAETIAAYEFSGINTTLRLVHAYREPFYVETSSDPFGDALDHITFTDDGKMEDVNSKREIFGADIVALIIGDTQLAGLDRGRIVCFLLLLIIAHQVIILLVMKSDTIRCVSYPFQTSDMGSLLYLRFA